MDQIIEHLVNSKHLLIASHANMDGDAVGSLLATGLAMAMVHNRVTLYSETPVPAVFRFLPSWDVIVHDINGIDTFDTAIILDCGDFDRIGSISDRIQNIPMIINIDHHVTNTGFGNCQLVDTEACATAEIVYRLIRKLNVPIDRGIAASIYTGILTDTGSFRFSNTTSKAFAICEEMVQTGVDPYEVAQHVYGYSLGRIRLLLLALNSIEISEDGNMSMMTLTRDMLIETGTTPDDVDGLINYARSIKNVKVAALIHQLEEPSAEASDLETYHVSLRSDGWVDVAKIAAAFGGGGHPDASGFKIESTLPDLKSRLFDLVGNI